LILRRTGDAYIGTPVPDNPDKKRIKNMLLGIVRFLHAWKRYGSAVHELSYLNDRELADIGITRSDIPRVAWEHAQELV
jgi:uncharacterized protein YjiS (DUF1127 family)